MALDYLLCGIKTARKNRCCDLCGKFIKANEDYAIHVGKADDEWFGYSLHLDCQDILEYYYDETGEQFFNNDNVEKWWLDNYCSKCIHGEVCYQNLDRVVWCTQYEPEEGNNE